MTCKKQEKEEAASYKGPYFSFEELNILSIFQRLFTQVAVFMRSYINASIFNVPSIGANAERLMKVAEEFRNAILLFYGPELANQFGVLFTSFIAKATNVIEGYLTGNQQLISQSVQSWYRNADELADFLGSINSFWAESQWRNLLYQYIQLKLQMISALVQKDYSKEIQVYDRVFDLTTIMGTYMARGIIDSQLRKPQ
jgi:hypothetical protein